MKKMIYLLMVLLTLTSCASKRGMERSLNAYYDSLLSIISREVSHAKSVEISQQTIIDTLRKVNLPMERSQNVLPVPIKRSNLETSLATSSAWVDSLGFLHHVLENKDSALIPQRKETLNHEKSETEATKTTTSNTTKVKGDVKTTEKEYVPVYVPKDRLAGKFFYYSGWIAWIVIFIALIYYLQKRTSIKPISRIVSMIRKIIKI